MKAPDSLLPRCLAPRPRCALRYIGRGAAPWLMRLAALLWLAPAAWAADFPQRFRLVCPQLLAIPADYPEQARLEQACQQLKRNVFSLTREGAHWRLSPALDGAAQAPLTLNRMWPPHTCLSAPFMAICQVPRHARIPVPGMGPDGWIQSRHGFILIAAPAGVFDLMPCDAVGACAPPAETGKVCDHSQP